MIEFKGKITGKTLHFHTMRYKKLFIFSSLLASLLVLLLYGWLYNFYIIVIAMFVVFFPVLTIISPKSFWRLLAPYRVYIDLDDRTIVSEIKGYPETFRMIDDIVEVKDHGDFYTFKFTSLRNQLNFIAQKDLITQGTIEEFEEIFEEVLVRVKK